jgi:AcrR family transcriptional regulator
MARTVSIKDEQILDAARQVFLEQGFNAPATEIAMKAGISSGSIFKRFETKEALFFAAMNCESQWAGGLEKLVGHGELKVNLEAIANGIFSFIREMLPRLMLRWSLRHEVNEQSVLAHDIRLLANFLKAEKEQGRLRPSLDTDIAATTMVGTMLTYGMLELVSGQPHEQPEVFIRDFIDTFWKGLIANPTDVF